MKFTFYLPRLQKYKIIYAKDESYAVWKLFNHFRLRENEIDNYKIIKKERNTHNVRRLLCSLWS